MTRYVIRPAKAVLEKKVLDLIGEGQFSTAADVALKQRHRLNLEIIDPVWGKVVLAHCIEKTRDVIKPAFLKHVKVTWFAAAFEAEATGFLASSFATFQALQHLFPKDVDVSLGHQRLRRKIANSLDSKTAKGRDTLEPRTAVILKKLGVTNSSSRRRQTRQRAKQPSLQEVD